MDNSSGYVTIGDNKLHYLQWGSGSKLLLAFHGYGNDAAIFTPLKEYLEQQYTILSFDLPHHGGSRWRDDAVLTKKDITTAVKGVMKQYSVDKVSLMGYSMGGRICAAIVEQIPESIDRVVLLAADGLVVNSYYYFFTRTWPGKMLFRNMIAHPGKYQKLLDALKDRKIIPESRHRYVSYFIQSAEMRNFLLRVWMSTSALISNPGRLRAIVKKYDLPVYIFMGVHDRVMPPRLAQRFAQGLNSVQVTILQRGHRVFDTENAAQIAAVLL